MSDSVKTEPNSPPASLARAINLAKAGNKAEAAAMLRQVVAAEPLNQAAWLWLSAVTTNPAEAAAALAQAKKINPDHASLSRAEQWLVHRFSPDSPTRQNPVQRQQPPAPTKKVTPPPPKMPSPPEPRRGWFGAVNGLMLGLAVLGVAIALFVLAFGVIKEIGGAAQASSPSQSAVAALRQQLDSAWAGHDWPAAITVLQQLQQLEPESAAIGPQLAQAHLFEGQSLRSRGFVAEAGHHFELARQFNPSQPQIEREAQLAAAYLRGVEHYQAGQWPQAIAELEQVWAVDTAYINVRDLLYSAYYNHALARQAAGEFLQARQELEAAIGLRPDLSDPHRLLAELEFAMSPGTPVQIPPATSLADRLILVGIAEQRMLVFDGDKLVFDFVVSTGEPGRDTAVGEFEILDKIDVAYASTWNLDMPYWMGIYWAGPLENGIHSLPIVKHTGYKLWDGYLGQRVSYGCVILGDDDAAKLYEWTEVGTKVKIVSSLADWLPQ